jgi:AraC-like DNA-binding protein
MEKTNRIENSIIALENTLGLSITVVDNAGAFHTNQGIAIFSGLRQSHKKNQVCDIGFCKKCRAHCRYDMNEKCAKYQEPFIETCWKGVSEIVVPLWLDGIHYGMLDAGSWRQAESITPAGLPKKFYAAYKKLPLLPETEKLEELKSILTVFSTGILTLLKELNAFEAVPDTRGNQIMEFIKAHAVEKLELADVAAHLNLSCSRTSYLIRSTLNKSFPKLLSEERLQRVKTLLTTSNMTLNELAAQTGFNDEHYLARIFKRKNGQTPGQYRKLHTQIFSDIIEYLTE